MNQVNNKVNIQHKKGGVEVTIISHRKILKRIFFKAVLIYILNIISVMKSEMVLEYFKETLE